MAQNSCSAYDGGRYHEGGQQVSLLGHLALLLCDGGQVLSVPLQQHPVVVIQLLLIQLVCCSHGLQVLLQGLNICLKPVFIYS